MRVMARITVPVEAGNAAIQKGSIGPVLQATADRWKPEAMYFAEFDGKRGAYVVFDMTDASDLPAFAEPFFQELDAEVSVVPAMDVEDMQKGLSALA